MPRRPMDATRSPVSFWGYPRHVRKTRPGVIIPEHKAQQIVVTAFLAVALIASIHYLLVTPSPAHAQAWPAYTGPAPSQQNLHGWPAYSRRMAYAPARPSPAAYATTTPAPGAQAWHGMAPNWGYVPLIPQAYYYPQPVAPTWPSYGVAVPYSPFVHPWPVYPTPPPYGVVAPPRYAYAPPADFGPTSRGYPGEYRVPEHVYHLTAEDQRIVDQLDRRLSRVKGILSESREFDTQAATVLFLNEIAEALEHLPQMHAQMRATNDEIRRMNYMMTALPVLAWDLHQVNQKVGLMAWDINRTMGRMGGMMSWMPFF